MWTGVLGAVNSDSNREGSSAVDGDAESVDDAASVACSEGSAAVSDADDLVESEAKSDGIETQSNEDETEDQREDDDTEGQSVGDETEEHRAEGEELSDEDEEESDAGSDGSSAADDSGVAEVEKETEDSEDDAESDEDDNDARMSKKNVLVIRLSQKLNSDFRVVFQGAKKSAGETYLTGKMVFLKRKCPINGASLSDWPWTPCSLNHVMADL